MPTREEIAWAAGLFEGEGSIAHEGKNTVRLSLGMTDRDVVESFHRIVGVGSVRRQPRPPHGRRDMYLWRVGNRDDVRKTIAAFYPFLHSRRRARIDELLPFLAANLGKHEQRTHCPQGHPLEGDNLFIYRDGRSCVICRRAAADRRHVREKAARRVAREAKEQCP